MNTDEHSYLPDRITVFFDDRLEAWIWIGPHGQGFDFETEEDALQDAINTLNP